jgi:murein DD-endopeptidase MepM/ murein hydrolase activator NlpD
MLVGANLVYFSMTRLRPRAACPQACPVAQAPASALPAAPTTPATTSARTTPAPAATPAAPISPEPTSPEPTTTFAGALGMPLPDLSAAQLHDTFDETRGGTRRHEALDIMAPAGTRVLAVADGHVEKLFTSDAGGLTIYQFEPSGRYAYYYAHLQGYAPGLREGQAVTRGQLLGFVGSTGNASPNAPHLHFAVFELGPEKQWWKGTAINPYPLLGGR